MGCPKRVSVVRDMQIRDYLTEIVNPYEPFRTKRRMGDRTRKNFTGIGNKKDLNLLGSFSEVIGLDGFRYLYLLLFLCM